MRITVTTANGKIEVSEISEKFTTNRVRLITCTVNEAIRIEKEVSNADTEAEAD